MTCEAPRLCLENIRLEIGGDTEDVLTLQLDRFDLLPGRVYVLFGESGVGKTTFLESLAGLRAPREAGRFVLHDLEGAGHDLSALYVQDRAEDLTSLRAGPVGYVPQGGGVLPFLSARENILIGTRNPQVAEARLEHLADWFDMGGHLGKRRSALSGGQRKRVALMRGLIQPRALLLLDEPTSGLDGVMADKTLDAVQFFASQERSAALIVMHDTERALRLGLPTVELRRSGEHGIQLCHAQDLAA